ncbi:MAG: transcriptional regulator [Candidatus Sumerlaeia bacterium]|nr:transcriptional regulator [Candidatus Sumerlaeia bacterium]
MKPAEFFQTHPVFRHEEFVAACYPTTPSGSRAAERALAYHQAAGRLVRIRRGLHAVRSIGSAANSFQIASRLAPDAVLAYHTALEYLGFAYSLWSDRFVLTTTKTKGFRHEEVRYRPIGVPLALDTPEKRALGVEVREDDGLAVRVTSLERTLVDLLDRPQYAGSWEELGRSFENAGFLDTRLVVQHTRNLGNRTTAARVGWFLEQHRDQWLVPETVLAEVQTMVPVTPVYLTRSHRESGTLHPRWNLIVPPRVSARIWEEVP